MRTVLPSRLLKIGLQLDAAGSGAVALLQLLASAALAGLLQLPRALLIETGVFMVGYVVLTLVLSRSVRVPLLLIGLVIAGNVAWAIGCAVLPLSGAVSPSGWGIAFLTVHAVSVLVFATLQTLGLRSSRAADASPLATAH